MAFDSGTTNAGSGGLVLVVDTFTDTDSVQRTVPYSGIAFGPINGPYLPVTTDDRFPVAATQSGSWTVGISGTVPISAAALPLPTGAATSAKQDTGNTSLASIDTKITACNTGAVVVSSGTLVVTQGTATNLKAQSELYVGGAAVANGNPVPISDAGGAITVDGTVGISGSVAVTGTFWQATQPVSDGSGSITVDAPVGTPVFVRLSDGSSAISTLPVSLASVPSHAVTNVGVFAVQASLNTAAIDNAGTALVPKFATIAASSSGNNTLVAAVSSKKIRVLAYNLIGNGAVNAKFQSGAGGTDLTGLKYIAAAGGGICAPFNPVGWFETASNTLLNLNLSGAVAVGGELVYVEV